jgi:type II secretory pathway component PulF
MILRIPRAADLSRSLVSARLARMLGVLVESKVPLLEALELTRDSLTNGLYVDLLRRAEESVAHGESVSAVLSSGDLLHPSVQEALRNGEQSGHLGAPLIHMADFLDEENEVVIKASVRLLEPLILVLLGVMVGAVAISMFLPLFDLVSATSGGGK